MPERRLTLEFMIEQERREHQLFLVWMLRVEDAVGLEDRSQLSTCSNALDRDNACVRYEEVSSVRVELLFGGKSNKSVLEYCWVFN